MSSHWSKRSRSQCNATRTWPLPAPQCHRRRANTTTPVVRFGTIRELEHSAALSYSLAELLDSAGKGQTLLALKAREKVAKHLLDVELVAKVPDLTVGLTYSPEQVIDGRMEFKPHLRCAAKVTISTPFEDWPRRKWTGDASYPVTRLPEPKLTHSFYWTNQEIETVPGDPINALDTGGLQHFDHLIGGGMAHSVTCVVCGCMTGWLEFQ